MDDKGKILENGYYRVIETLCDNNLNNPVNYLDWQKSFFMVLLVPYWFIEVIHMKKEKEIYLTSEGFLKLEEELDHLKKVERPEVIEAIKEARALGDLSENAEYSSARERQGKLEARIKEIEYTLEHATIIENNNDGKVRVGSVITIKYLEDDEDEEYSIVGTNEADPFENKISNESPIAQAVMGKKVGDKVSVESPNGSFDIEIVKVA